MRRLVQSKVAEHADKWPCSCIAVGTAKRSARQQCPVHKPSPAYGIASCFRKLQRAFQGCCIRVIAEMPMMTVNGVQGRCMASGQFIPGPDLYFDFVVIVPTGLLYAVEVCGRHHAVNGKDAGRDDKKVTAASKVGLQIAWLFLNKYNEPEHNEWKAEVSRAKAWLEV